MHQSPGCTEEAEDFGALSCVSSYEADYQTREYGNYDPESDGIKEDCGEYEYQCSPTGLRPRCRLRWERFLDLIGQIVGTSVGVKLNQDSYLFSK